MKIELSVEAEPDEVAAIVAGFGNPKRDVPVDIEKLEATLSKVTGIIPEQVGEIIKEYVKRN
jgi:hypothetical protein